MGAIPLSEVGKAILYTAPSTSTRVVCLKKASYPKGHFPEHLKKFAADLSGLNKCPVGCKGETGLSYSGCLRACAEKIDFKALKAKAK